jgi:hypothetical protein
MSSIRSKISQEIEKPLNISDVSQNGFAGLMGKSAERYLSILNQARGDICAIFTDAELDLIAGVFYGSSSFEEMVLNAFTDCSLPHLDDHVFEQYDCNQEMFRENFRYISLDQRIALIDAMERYWHLVSLEGELGENSRSDPDGSGRKSGDLTRRPVSIKPSKFKDN